MSLRKLQRAARRTGSKTVHARIFATSCILLAAALPAHAQDRYDGFGRVQVQSEVPRASTKHLGTIRIRGTEPPPRESQSPRGEAASDLVNAQDRATERLAGPLAPEFAGVASNELLKMFADARAAQARGDTSRAITLFERVIASQPNGRLADAARRDLAKLYSVPSQDVQDVEAADTQSTAHRTQARKEPNESGARSVAAPEAIVVPRSRRVVMLERQFIADVGDRVFFERGRADLGARARDVIETQAQWLSAHPDLAVIVQGYADDGDAVRRIQDDLSLKRAEAVRQLLIADGVSSQRVRTEAFGRSRPVAACPTASCQAQNRRVVTKIEDRPIRTAGDGFRAPQDKRFLEGRAVANRP